MSPMTPGYSMSTLSDSNNSIHLIGDLNARTRFLPNYIETNSRFINQGIIPIDLLDYMNYVEKIRCIDIPLERSEYEQANFSRSVGETTHKGVSVMDCALAGTSFVLSTADFEIHNLGPLNTSIVLLLEYCKL